MRKISDTNAVMNVVVNPFTKEVSITHRDKKKTYLRLLTFKELDEWQEFKTNKLYDTHFSYDEEDGFEFSIYPVIKDVVNGKGFVTTDTRNSIPINLDYTKL